jgi:uncharacterized membrane protein YeaQ/YmgE (transglycosylase-associated protein family)
VLLGVLIFLLIFALVVGTLARLVLPGGGRMGIPATVGLGVAGVLVGGLVSHVLTRDAGGMHWVVASVVSATVILFVYRFFVQNRRV